MHSHWTKNGHRDVIVLLHGFMGDSTAYSEAVTRLSPYCDILRIDLPGHGADKSPVDVQWSFDWIMDELHRTLSPLKSSYEHLTLYGYSMGGRLALYYALQHGTDALILESTSPGLRGRDERATRRALDQERASSLMADYPAFVSGWEKLPLFKPSEPLTPETARHQHVMRSSQDPVRLAKALTDYGTGSQPDLWDALPSLTMPVLLLTGTLDTKFRAINDKMAALLACHHIEVPAGHSIHVEHPEIFDTIVVEFMKEAYHV